MSPTSKIPTEIANCFKDAHSALTALEQAVEGVIAGSEAQAAAKFKMASVELESQRDEAIAKLRRMEEEAGRKKSRIASLQEQVDSAEADAKRKDAEIERLEALVEKLKRGISSSPGKSRISRSAIAVRAASRSRSRGKANCRSRSRSTERGRQRSEAASRRRRRRGSGSSKSSRGSGRAVSSSRSGSPGSMNGEEGEVDMGSWADRRAGGDGRDSALCIPFIIGHCRNGERCKQRHPGDDDVREARDALRRKTCRFGATCRRTDCIFRHDGRRGAERDSCRATPCRYGSSCKRPDCKFMHSWDRDKKPMWKGEGSDPGPPGAADKPCRYGAECKRADCAFYHPR